MFVGYNLGYPPHSCIMEKQSVPLKTTQRHVLPPRLLSLPLSDHPKLEEITTSISSEATVRGMLMNLLDRLLHQHFQVFWIRQM